MQNNKENSHLYIHEGLVKFWPFAAAIGVAFSEEAGIAIQYQLFFFHHPKRHGSGRELPRVRHIVLLNDELHGASI